MANHEHVEQEEGHTIAQRPGESSSGTNKTNEEEIPSGELIDHFRVLRPIGKGGMGRVYLARDTKLGRKVALKLVRPRKLGADHAVRRFIQEARTTARFNHPNIVTIYEVGEYRGQPYLALEYLNGQTLRERIRSNAPSLQETLRFGAAMASALAEAHRHGVLHLDLKPGNILIPQDGRIRVLDFGLAQPMTALRPVSRRENGSRTGSQTGGLEFVGTPRYMAPEQWRREVPTAATDVWGFGVVLYELACGERPFKDFETNPLTLAQAVSGPRPAPRMQTLPELADLLENCLKKDPSDRPTAEEVSTVLQALVSGPRRGRVTEESPFRGLLPFTARHADVFFGREREIAELAERLRTEPVMPVVGASGAGKSSLIQAGLIPRLTEQGKWEVLELRPGPEPFKSLAHRVLRREYPTATDSASGMAAARTNLGIVESVAQELYEFPERLSVLLEQLAEAENTRVLLFVDQLEELYTLSSDEEQQNRFIRAVARAADDAEDPVRVVFTVRDDYLSRLANAGTGVRSVLRRMTLLQVPDQSALVETLTKPVETIGYSFESPEMVAQMVQEVGGKASSLPLLQFAAQMLWERRDRERRVLTKETYEELGGIAGALARHADGVLDALIESEVGVAREILLRLVTSDDTRRVVARNEVLEGLGPEAEGVLSRLVSARLVSAVRLRDQHGAQQALELAHESLIRVWGRLRTWIDENRDELRFLAEVGQAAELWEKRGRHIEEVWTGNTLAEALGMLERCAGPIPEKVDRFLAAGRQRQRQRELQKRGVITGAFLLISLVAAVLFVQWRDAMAQRQRAELERAEAQREGAAAAVVRGDILEARAKIRSSLETADSTLARAIWWRIREDALLWRREASSNVWRINFSPDGKTVAAALSDGTVHLYDVMTRRDSLLAAYRVQLAAIQFSPDGRMIAIANNEGLVTIFDVAKKEVVRAMKGHRSAVRGLAFVGDDHLVTADLSGRLLLWNISTGKKVQQLRGPGQSIRALAYHEKKGILVTAGVGGRIHLWNPFEGRIRSIKVGDGKTVIDDVTFSPDGAWIIEVGKLPQVRIWSTESGALVRTIPVKAKPLTVDMSADGRLVVGGRDKLVKLFDAASGTPLVAFQGHTHSVLHVEVSPDGRFIASGGLDKSIRLWDALGGTPPSVSPPHTESVYRMEFSPDGRTLATGGIGQKVRLWDLETGQVTRTLGGDEGILWALAFSPDGSKVAWGGKILRTASVHGSGSGLLVRGFGPEIRGVRFNADGSRLFTVEQTKLKVYDLEGTIGAQTLDTAKGKLMSLALSPDGRWLAAGGADRYVRVWDSASGKMKARLQGHDDSVWGVDFDPTGRFLGSAGADGDVRLWNWSNEKGRLIGRNGTGFYDMDFSRNGRWIATSAKDGTPRLWDVRAGRLHREFPRHSGEVNTVRFSPNGKWLATAADNGNVQVFDVRTGQPFWRAPLLLSKEVELLTHRGWIDLDSGKTKSPPSTEWRNAVKERAQMAVVIPKSDNLCLVSQEGGLELWNRAEDRLIRKQAVPGIKEIWGMEGACVVRAQNTVFSFKSQASEMTELAGLGVMALGAANNEIVWARSSTITVVDASGSVNETYPNQQHVSAVALSESWVLVGREYGGLKMLPRTPGAKPRSFDDTPASPVTRILLGPQGTLLAGFENGTVGLWNIDTGGKLYTEQLHGRITHLVRLGQRVYMASDLGWFTRWDLDVFHQASCEVLEDVWGKVPVVWSSGRALARTPPPEHRCRQTALARGRD